MRRRTARTALFVDVKVFERAAARDVTLIAFMHHAAPAERAPLLLYVAKTIIHSAQPATLGLRAGIVVITAVVET